MRVAAVSGISSMVHSQYQVPRFTSTWEKLDYEIVECLLVFLNNTNNEML